MVQLPNTGGEHLLKEKTIKVSPLLHTVSICCLGGAERKSLMCSAVQETADVDSDGVIDVMVPNQL